MRKLKGRRKLKQAQVWPEPSNQQQHKAQRTMTQVPDKSLVVISAGAAIVDECYFERIRLTLE